MTSAVMKTVKQSELNIDYGLLQHYHPLAVRLADIGLRVTRVEFARTVASNTASMEW